MAEGRDQLTAGDFLSGIPGPVVIPDHELVCLIGKGSYGEVWLSRSVLGSWRAVKIVFEKNFRHKRPYERELNGVRKFEPNSRLHEGLMDVLQVGHNDSAGYFYCVMELADDVVTGQNIDPDRYSPRTLAHDIALHKRLPVAECRRLGLAIASALGFLHSRGLIHRDVKPSNIVFVEGIPKLVDIGLVAEMSEARSYVGTEGFIPPEGPGTVQADIYSLGKVLYEMSTGRDRHDYPELPTLVEDADERAEILKFNQLVVNACRSNPRERFQSGREMVEDLMLLEKGLSPKRRHFAGRKRMRWAALGILLPGLCAGLWLSRGNRNQKAEYSRVVPNYLASNEVPFGSGVLKSPCRDQVVYDAEEFPPGPITISELRFRPDAYWGHAFNTTVSNLEIHLSATPKKHDELSATFAENTGANDTLVFRGPLKISSRFAGPVGGPKEFDIVIPLQRPFLYNPDAGNLLVDIINFSGSEAALFGGGEPFVSGPGKDRCSRAVATNALAVVASFVNTGADVLQIVYENTSVRMAAWRAEGDASDSQGKNSGELHEVTFAPGKIGQAFQFNGSNSFVNVPGAPAFRFTGPFSLVAWVKYDRITGDYGDTIFMKGPPEDPDADWDWGMSISSGKKLRPHVNVSGNWQWFDCKTTLQPGTWYHLALVFDGTRLKGFVNGELDGEQGAAGPLRTSDLPIRLGCASPTEPLKTASFLAGKIDEAAVYRGALSEKAIHALYKSQLSR